MGATLYSKRYREFGGKEQRPEPRVREFRKFGTASLRGITVFIPTLQNLTFTLHFQNVRACNKPYPEVLSRKISRTFMFFSAPSGPCPVNDVVGLNNEEENKIIVDGTCYM